MRFILATAFLASLSGASAQRNKPSPRALGTCRHYDATQLRHLKLSFAGAVQNWDLAKYELGRCRGASLPRAILSVFGEVPVARLIDDISEPALAEVDKAIAAMTATPF